MYIILRYKTILEGQMWDAWDLRRAGKDDLGDTNSKQVTIVKDLSVL